MSDYLSPGVYIQELEGPAPIVGVSTSIAGFVGMAERGPVNTPILCTDVGDYTRWFGGQLYPDEFADIADQNRSHCYLPYAVAGFYANSGQLLYVTRVVPENAPYATDVLYDRGNSASITYTLMKGTAIGDGIGTTPAGGALLTIAPGPPTGTVRLGNGSQSDYPTVTATTPVTDSVAIDQVLQLGHAAGTAFISYARTPQGAHPITLNADAVAGQSVIVVSTTDSLATFAELLLEITDGAIVAIVVPISIVAFGGNLFSVTLSQALTASFAAATATIAALIAGTTSPYATVGPHSPYTLSADANAGATTISVVSPTDDLATFANYVLVLTCGSTSAVVSPSGVVVSGTTYTMSISPALPSIFAAATTKLYAVSSTPNTGFDVVASAGDYVLYVAGGSALPALALPIKRLMIYIEESLVQGLQDVVFEPNAPPLWAEVERLIANFLTTIWAAGGLQGATPDQSFFVRCDLTTMTQTDIINGRLIAVVGVAPVYPAEFVIIQIQLTVPSTGN